MTAPDEQGDWELRFSAGESVGPRIAGCLGSGLARYRPDGVDCDGWVYTEYFRDADGDGDGSGDRSIRVRQYGESRLTRIAAPGLAVFEDKSGGRGASRAKTRWTFQAGAMEAAAGAVSPAALAGYLVASPPRPYPRLPGEQARAAAAALPGKLLRMFSVSYHRTHYLAPGTGVRVTVDDGIALLGPGAAGGESREVPGIRVELKGGRHGVRRTARFLGLEPGEANAPSKRALGLRLFTEQALPRVPGITADGARG